MAFILVFTNISFEDVSLVGYDAVSLALWLQTFQRNVLHSSLRVKQSFAQTVSVLMTKTVRSLETLGTTV